MQHVRWPSVASKAADIRKLEVNTPLTIGIFGNKFGGECNVDWTFKGFEDLHAQEKNRVHAERLVSIMEDFGVQDLYAPSPTTFNGRVCEVSEFERTLELIPRSQLYLHRGPIADGCRIKEGEAIGWSVGGCAIIVALFEDKVVAAHAGRDCLFDRAAALEGKEKRPHESVVFSAAEALTKNLSMDAADIHLQVLYPLQRKTLSHPINDPVWGEINKRMYVHFRNRWGVRCGVTILDGYVCIDTLALVRAQCESIGINPEHVSMPTPHADTIEGVHHTRHPDPKRRGMRNFAIVARPW